MLEIAGALLLVAGTLFVLPGFFAILALSFVYVLGSGVALVEGLFFGIKPAVLALVLEALVRIGRRALLQRQRADELRLARGAGSEGWVGHPAVAAEDLPGGREGRVREARLGAAAPAAGGTARLR